MTCVMSVIAADESARAAGRRRARAVSRKPRSEGEGDEAEADKSGEADPG